MNLNWARQDSNLQSSGYEPLALTIELRARSRSLRQVTSGAGTRAPTLPADKDQAKQCVIGENAAYLPAFVVDHSVEIMPTTSKRDISLLCF